jgi:hypothetical protein
MAQIDVCRTTSPRGTPPKGAHTYLTSIGSPIGLTLNSDRLLAACRTYRADLVWVESEGP